MGEEGGEVEKVGIIGGIPVNDILPVNIVQRFEELLHEAFYFSR